MMQQDWASDVSAFSILVAGPGPAPVPGRCSTAAIARSSSAYVAWCASTSLATALSRSAIRAVIASNAMRVIVSSLRCFAMFSEPVTISRSSDVRMV